MTGSHRHTVLIVLLLVFLVSGIACPDSMWVVDMSACLRLHDCPVSGGAPNRSMSIGGDACASGMAVGGGSLWMLGPLGCTRIAKTDLATGDVSAVLTLNVSCCGTSLAYGDGYLWVLLDHNRIAKVDPSSGQIICTVAPPITYRIEFMTYGGGYLWIIDGAYYGRISKVDPSSGAILQSINAFGTDLVRGLTYGGDHLWVAGLMSAVTVTKVDPANGAIISTAAYGTGWPTVIIAYAGDSSPPPSAPTVTDDGAYTPDNDHLHAAWTGVPGIAEYQYAIGTSPSSLAVDWRSAGVGVEATETGLSLQTGTTYYWYVKARDSAGKWSGVGESDGVMVGTPVPISTARSVASSHPVILGSVIVTALFDDCTYVEAADRSSGIRIIDSPPLSLGDKVDIAGEAEIVSGEKSVRAITCSVVGSGETAPVGMPTSGIAVYGPNDGVVSAMGTAGLCSAGLLVRTWGLVTVCGSGFFYVDDGSHLKDGTGNTGLRVLCDGLPAPVQGKRVQVTGISTLFPHADTYFPALRLRDSADLKVLD